MRPAVIDQIEVHTPGFQVDVIAPSLDAQRDQAHHREDFSLWVWLALPVGISLAWWLGTPKGTQRRATDA